MLVEQEQATRRRRALAGAALAVLSSVGLTVFSALSLHSTLSDYVVFPLVFGLAVLMGCGATLAIFNIKQK